VTFYETISFGIWNLPFGLAQGGESFDFAQDRESFDLAQDRESFDLAQDRESFDLAQDREPVERPVEPFVIWDLRFGI